MNWLQNFIARLFRIEPARDRVITIREVERLKLEQGVQDLEEPGLTMKAGEFETSLEEGENDEGKSRTTDLQDEPKGVPGVSGSSKRAGTDGRVRSEKE